MRVTSDTLGARTGRPRRPEAEEGGQNIKHNDTDNTSAQGRRLPGARWRTTTTVGSPKGLVKEGLVVGRLAQARPMKGEGRRGPMAKGSQGVHGGGILHAARGGKGNWMGS